MAVFSLCPYVTLNIPRPLRRVDGKACRVIPAVTRWLQPAELPNKVFGAPWERR
jgi:hypothetical protein